MNTPAELNQILADHAKWLLGEGGTRANLSWANLSRANLSGANLSWADLSGANLSWANLSGASLSWANLSRANLSKADLFRANLSRADLSKADLFRANLSGANLSWANLSGAYLSGAALPPLSIVPESGAFDGWKKLQGGVLARVRIPESAGRVNSTGRACRAEWVTVVELVGGVEGRSRHDDTVVYRVGQEVRPDKWDPDFRVECSHGIHFFLTRKEAEGY